MRRYFLLCFGLVAACVDPAESTTELAVTSSYVTAVDNAGTSYAGTVVQNVVANAAAVSRPISASAVHTAFSRGRTVAAAAAARSQLVFVSRQITDAGLTFQPGLYEIAATGTGATVYYFDPAAGRLDLHLTATPHQQKFHTPLGDDMCGDAPEGSVMDFCQRMCACFGYGLLCDGNDSVPGEPPNP
jgi:hypothetical protein